jgi:soluble lytic murein transglycosylase-like protein
MLPVATGLNLVHAKIIGFTKLHCAPAGDLWHAIEMRAAMKIPVGVLITAGLVTAVPARADVMAITDGEAHWVAGGPVARRAVHLAVPRSTTMPVAWRSTIALLAERYDLSPAVIEALVWQESRWQAGAISPKGARGLAQLMPRTAQALGANADDPVQNVAAGAYYLHTLLGRFHGNLEQALAAYNAGPARVAQAGGVPPIAETRGYVAAILARLAAQSYDRR